MQEIKVAKFGGSSLADAKQFEKVYDIVKEDSARRFVVPSAPGKRSSDDIKVTDMLYSCYEQASKGLDFSEAFSQIKERYNSIIRDLGLCCSLENEFEKIRIGFTNKSGRDYAASRGEYLSGIILAYYLGFEFIDAAEVIFFKEGGAFDSERTQQVLSRRLKNVKNAVIPGFYGAMPNDTIKTFSRGGSDITGSIVARAVGASLYENFTDVSGFLVADPRIVKNPKVIRVITYQELRELSYMGATVLHEDAIFPVSRAGIPINIRNTNDKSAQGTLIVKSEEDMGGLIGQSDSVITGIAGKKGFSVIYIEKQMMNAEIGFGRKVLEVLENKGISFEHLPSGVDTMSIVVEKAALAGKETELIYDLQQAVSPDRIEIENSLALMAIVGRRMRSTKGTAAKIFAALADSQINIRMIDQGSSELNIIVGVSEEDFEEAVRAAYRYLA